MDGQTNSGERKERQQKISENIHKRKVKQSTCDPYRSPAVAKNDCICCYELNLFSIYFLTNK